MQNYISAAKIRSIFETTKQKQENILSYPHHSVRQPINKPSRRSGLPKGAGNRLRDFPFKPLPEIGEGLGVVEAPHYNKEGLGWLRPCRSTLHYSRPSLGALNLCAKEKDRLGCGGIPHNFP